ncbi:DUF421 domain-containing protein [Aureibacillus halotolerans]|uniref:Uncharacterized membrane protein YcaP (DUF421 family) n=1 Tax=Aureibacillus halotolerans TaxID=1508390 RepID=A0A4V3D543_9BACI|nr:DUF421 domain-containing protein [Aureibacillus halotolerans]TDQ38697.1 uncharacterized membrane protein YcaP (DUF421 family) [Aureibacillus halotolerans]
MYGHILLELVVGYALLLCLTKLLGKTQMNQITAFDFIAVIVLGELIGNGLYDQEVTLWHICYAAIVWGILSYVTEIITQKFKKTRSFLEGNPSIVVRSGYLQQKEMAKNKMDVNQLQHLLRAKDIFSLRDVAFAILETDGSVSVVKEPPSSAPPPVLPVVLVTDGELIKDNLREANISEETLLQAMQQQGASKYQDLLYAEWKADAMPPLHVNLMRAAAK